MTRGETSPHREVRSGDVTVVIPAYQAERLVPRAIESALAQRPTPAAVIVVDDGSTDDTAAVVRGFAPDVELVTIAHGGEAAARNAGLHAARTDWVAFLDADDWFLPERIAESCAALTADPSLDAITSDAFMVIDDEIRGLCYGSDYRFEHDRQDLAILHENFVFGHVVADRARLLALGGFDESISHTADWAMWVDLVLDGGRIGFLDRPLSGYRVHTGSASADQPAMLGGRLETLRRAARRDDLDEQQRATVESAIAATERNLERLAMLESLRRNEPCGRDLARSVVLHDGHSYGTRAAAALAAVSPRAAAGLLEHRQKGRQRATAGWYVDAPDPGDERDHMRPLVTVVLPFLDERRFLRGAVDTVLAQTTQSWELLLVDDGSTDGSGRIADDLAAEHPGRIRVLRHADGRNEGLAASRNLGLAHARGSALAFLDADDRWEPDKLELQLLAFGAHPDAGMVAGSTLHQFHDLDRPDEVFPISGFSPGMHPPARFARQLVRERVGMPPPPSSVLYRTSALRGAGGVPVGPTMFEDQRTFVAVSIGEPMLITDDVLTTYARRSDSTFGRLADDNLTKARDQREFEWWVLSHARSRLPGQPRAAIVAIALVAHRVRVALGRRIRLLEQRTRRT